MLAFVCVCGGRDPDRREKASWGSISRKWKLGAYCNAKTSDGVKMLEWRNFVSADFRDPRGEVQRIIKPAATNPSLG